MSITLARLAALKREAGAPAHSPGPPHTRSTQADAETTSATHPRNDEARLQDCEPKRHDRPADPAAERSLIAARAPAMARIHPADGTSARRRDLGGSGALLEHAHPPRSESSPAPDRERSRIRQLRQLLRLRGAGAVARAPRSNDRALPGEEIAPGLRLATVRRPLGPPPPVLSGSFDRRDDFDPARVLFFDTETTGLAGGTGTRAFMIGAARWQDDGFEVRQLLITTLSAEAAMLAEFARWLGPGTILASYNGRSYDSPLLRTRYRLARMPDPLAGLDHIDLLYPSRRRWRGVYENCRLATIERRVLEIVREDDLPGSEAPAAWLGYLRGGSSRNLRRVAAHNHQDVVSLSRLMLHLDRQARNTIAT